jgi:hypothetical protein
VEAGSVTFQQAPPSDTLLEKTRSRDFQVKHFTFIIVLLTESNRDEIRLSATARILDVFRDVFYFRCWWVFYYLVLRGLRNMVMASLVLLFFQGQARCCMGRKSDGHLPCSYRRKVNTWRPHKLLRSYTIGGGRKNCESGALRWNDTERGNPKNWEQNLPSSNLSTINPTWFGSGSKSTSHAIGRLLTRRKCVHFSSNV